jgi:PAS domain S-box-containing protein
MIEKKALSRREVDLRKKPEEIARVRTSPLSELQEPLSMEKVQQALHELQVHQIELEMQNEELRRGQAELESMRARYFDLYDLAPVGYCTLNKKGLILEANLTAATLLHAARGALVKQPISRFILKEDQNIYYLHRKLLFETASPQVCKLRMVRQNGSSFLARMEATPPRDADGEPVCRIVISEIAEHMQREEVLIQNERFAQLLNELDALVYVVDMKTYEIIFINTYGQNIWGDITGNICWQTIQVGQNGPCEFCTNSKLIGPDGNPTAGVAWEFQNTVNKRWFDCRDRAINWPDGRIVRMEIATDITRRKEAEEALAAERDLLAETNTTLRVLLNRREEDQKEMERTISRNIQKLVFPYLETLRNLKLNARQASCLDGAEANLNQIVSPFLKNLTARFADFTPREIQVANMIREGKTSKEIAGCFNSSIRSVEFHRDNIRKKLGLNQKKTNLRTFLMNLSEK